MKKADLKKILKPIVKECIQEALLEEGLLSNIIAEVVKGLGANKQPIVEQKQNNDDEIEKLQLEEKRKRSKKINETRQKMLDAVGNSSYNGVDLFEGTTPLGKAGSPGEAQQAQGALSDVAPGDAGIDISNLMGNISTWKQLAGNNK
jgi:hypothetical protein